MKKVLALIALLVIAVILLAGWQIMKNEQEPVAAQINHSDPSATCPVDCLL